MISEIINRAAITGSTVLELRGDGEVFELQDKSDENTRPFAALSNAAARNLVAIVKNQARMDLAERRKPQTGSFIHYASNHRVEVSAETGVDGNGIETLVLRLTTSLISSSEVRAASRAYDKVLRHLDSIGGRKVRPQEIYDVVKAMQADIAILA